MTFSELKEEKRIQQIDLLCNKRSHCTSQNPSPQLLRLENSIRKYWTALHAEPLFHSNFRSDFLFAIRIIKSKIRFADAPYSSAFFHLLLGQASVKHSSERCEDEQ